MRSLVADSVERRECVSRPADSPQARRSRSARLGAMSMFAKDSSSSYSSLGLGMRSSGISSPRSTFSSTSAMYAPSSLSSPTPRTSSGLGRTSSIAGVAGGNTAIGITGFLGRCVAGLKPHPPASLPAAVAGLL